MPEKLIPLHCPKCRQMALQYRPELELDQEITCIGCSARVKCTELVTADGKTPLDIVADAAKQVFSGIKGFKPAR